MRIQLVLVSILLASCSSAYLPTFTPYKVEIRQGNLVTQEMRAKLKLRMTQAQVKAALGAPLVNDPYHANRWDYVYRFERDGELIENQRLTLYFTNDLLTRIDDATPLVPTEAVQQERENAKN